jgi:tRNA threonylcarbamoyladenosine biosynthesis protein TsaB
VILAVETSTRASSAAICREEGQVVVERVDLEGPAHTQRLLPLVHLVLTEAATSWDEIDTVVCGLGPGAYTGMRIGVATARALAQASGVVLGGVPTLAAVALELAGTVAPGAPLVPLLDGKRSEVFAACYRGRGAAAGCPGARAGHAGVVDEVAPLAVVASADLPAYLARFPGAAIGGDGAVLYEDLLPRGSAPAVAAPTAAMVARAWLAGAPGIREGFENVLPIYGRDPDAAKWAGRTAG